MPPAADEFERHVRKVSDAQHQAWLESVTASPAASEHTAPVPFRPKRLKRYTALFEAAGRALHERREVSIETNAGVPMQFRIIRFRDGTSCLEHSLSGRSGGHERLDKRSDTAEELTRTIIGDFYGARVRPIAGQQF
ncbi:MAG: hypothetical protein WD770_03295 [Actinomycetota bacterium]